VDIKARMRPKIVVACLLADALGAVADCGLRLQSRLWWRTERCTFWQISFGVL
jgi:hypothetical protein